MTQAAHANRSFDADHPIQRRAQDELGRCSFADSIAREIVSVPTQHSFTVAVTGEWGSGKTSVLNMVIETIESIDRRTAVLHFNPWLFGGAQDLVARFFGELSAQLRRDRFTRLKDVATALLLLGQHLASISPEPTTNFIGKASKLVGRGPRPPSLIEVRDDLGQALSSADSRIVVVVDDIDRLQSGEIREVIRLVRLTADLPNVTFLLAFDRRRVAASLSEHEMDGQSYLDKIVQRTYQLPAIRDAVLRDVFFAGLEELIKTRDVSELDRETWARVFYELVKPLLGTLRDVKRYLYSLPVTLDAVKAEVALADVLGLEALRILRPTLFEDLRSHTEYLVHSDVSSGLWVSPEEHRKKARVKLSGMLDRAAGEGALLRAAFEILFPATQEFLGGGTYDSSFAGSWRRHRRVASSEVFRIYLEAGLGDSALSSAAIQDLFAALTDEEALARSMDALDDSHFEEALERLEDFQYEFPPEAVDVAVPVLLNRMGRLSDRPPGMFEFSPRVKATRVIIRLLRRSETPEDLATSAHCVLDKVDRLSAGLTLIRLVGPRASSPGLVGEADLKGLEDRLFDRLGSATADELAAEWDLAAISMRALSRPDEEQVGLTASLRRHLSSDRFVLALLHSAIGWVISDEHTETRLPWDELLGIFGSGLDEAISRLAGSQLLEDASEEDRELVRLASKYGSGWRPAE